MQAPLIALLVAAAIAAPIPSAAAATDRIARGGYLVNGFGCADCHTPLKPGPAGPQPDIARGLSGHPQDAALPSAPLAQGPWLWGGAATNTAFWGPWGVSFAANLTPDAGTGIGRWREADFIAAMRRGRHLGKGRALLPPMPWRSIGQLTDADLGAMFAYLAAQPAVTNQVPAALPPAATAAK